MNKISKIKRILYPIGFVILVFAGWNLWSIYKSENKTTDLYDSLSRQKNKYQNQEQRVTESAKNTGAESDGRENGERTTERTAEKEDGIVQGQNVEAVNAWLVDMKQQNVELAGWITVPNTVIDYPVMQTVEDNDFYLTHDFDKQENSHGAPFADVNCILGESDNQMIYGHHMKDGTMFAGLMEYENHEFCEKNDDIIFYTSGKTMRYEVIYVMNLSSQAVEEFPYYRYIDFGNDYTYEDYLSQCRKYALWSRREIPEEKGRLLTLSTCEYSGKDGKFVIVAREVLEE